MNYVFSIVDARGLRILTDICEKLALPVVLTAYGRGTATNSMLDRLGLESREKRIVMAVANEEKTAELIREQRRRLYIDAPGNGVVIAVPVKSVGGGEALAYLNGGETVKKKLPELDPRFELIVAIANEGHTDTVMDAARSAGASGGTVIHAKGTGADDSGRFFKVSIASEKEVVLILSKTGEKANIMSAVLSKAGPGTEAGAILFSLPVSDIAGFRIGEE
jgi:nitrogen regulatory protein PII